MNVSADLINKNKNLILPADFPLGLIRLCFSGGCLYVVFSIAIVAAACCAFFILAPCDVNSSVPNFNVTVKFFLCAGPCSVVKRY